jgi:RNA polymerase sigma factor (sigma-70 family)
LPGLHGRSPLLRLAPDERLVTLIRRGHHGAFEALVGRYQARLLAFCRHMLASKEDAEDVLQEVFAAAFNAMQADDRPLNVRPWLYRIARNRSLNHLRRQQPIGVDSMDVHYSEGGLTTADKVHRREDFRLLLSDVQGLPETQRTALLLREIDALSYEQIGEAMDTTVPSVKSLLVRARVALAEAAEARQLSCDAVRFELGEVAEGLTRMTAPVRRHVKGCDRCGLFRHQLRETNKALAAVFPVGPLVVLKKLVLAHVGTAAGGSASSAAGTAAGSAAGTAAASGAISAGVSAVATKAAAGIAAAAIVTAGAVEVRHVSVETHRSAAAPLASASTGGVAAPVSPAPRAQPAAKAKPKPRTVAAPKPVKPAPSPVAAAPPAPPRPAPVPAPPPPPRTQTVTHTVALPSAPVSTNEGVAGPEKPSVGAAPGSTPPASGGGQPTPVVGEYPAPAAGPRTEPPSPAGP